MSSAPLELRLDVKDKLQQISDTFIEPIFRKNLAFCGTAKNNISNPFNERPSTNDKLNNLVPILMSGYSNFKNAYNSEIVRRAPTSVKYRRMDSNSAYIDLTLNDNHFSFKDYGLTSNVEISIHDFVNAGSSLRTVLDDTCKLYSLLDDTNYNNYKYLLANSNVANVNINLVGFGGAKTTIQGSGALQNTNFTGMMSLINSLKSINAVNTESLTTTNQNNINATIVPPPVDSFRPPETISDSLLLMTPGSTDTDSYTTDVTIDDKIVGDGSTVRYYTVSYYAKMRNDSSGDAMSTKLLSTFLMGNATTQGNVSMATTSIPYFTQYEDYVSTTWTKISHTVTYKLPNNTNAKLQFRLYVDHEGATNKQNMNVYITGFQVDLSESEPAPDAPTFKLPQFDDSRSNRIVIRRLLLLYYLMASYYVTVAIKDNNFGSAPQTSSEKRATALTNLMYEYMMNYTRNMLKDTPVQNSDGTMGSKSLLTSLNDNVSSRFNTYQQNTQTLTTLGKTLSDKQYDLKSNVNTMNSAKKMMDRTTTYMYAALAVFLVVAVACLVVFVLPLDQKQKIMTALAVGGIGIVILMIYMFVYSQNVKEEFQAQGLLQSPGNYSAGLRLSDVAEYQNDSSIVALNYAAEYLDNTIKVALLLQTYVGYGNVNFALDKEITHYNGINSQVGTSIYKVKSASNVYTINKYSNRALISMFVTIGVLVAVTISALVLTQNYPGLRIWILSSAGFILFCALMFYMMDTSARVRTKATNIYWGTPNLQGL